MVQDRVEELEMLRSENARLRTALDSIIEASSVMVGGKKAYPPECMQTGRVLIDAIAQAKAQRDAAARLAAGGSYPTAHAASRRRAN